MNDVASGKDAKVKELRLQIHRDKTKRWSVMKFIQRGLLVATGAMIYFSVANTKKLTKAFDETATPENFDFYMRTSFASTSKLKSKSTSNTPRTDTNSNANSNANSKKERRLVEDAPNTDEKKKQETEQRQNKKDTDTKGGDVPNQPNSDPVAEDDRLNIVLFYADDWTMKVLGKLDPNVKTPNIDRMADNGMLFVNNCVTTSVCWVSRATLMTGTYYSRHQQSVPSVRKMFDTHNWNDTLFPRLRTAGYYTGLFGKWHSPAPSPEMNAAFDERILYFGNHWTSEFSGYGNDTMEHVTEVNRKHAVKFLENRPKDKKFALKVSFFATHAEDNTIPSYKPMNWSRLGLYPDDASEQNYQTIVPSKTATEQHWKDMPHFFNEQNAGRTRWKKRWEPGVWQKNIRDLFAMATEVDWVVGEIIKTLKKQGVYNETLLVFTTDNGDLHGEHGMAEKWYPLEESMKVPLVIQDPRMPSHKKGSINSDWTLNVDLAPTLLGAAGLAPSSFMQGRDIAELYLSGNANHNKHTIEPQTERKTEQKTETEPTAKKWETNIRRYGPDTNPNAALPWREDWFYEWNIGDPVNASGHSQDGYIDAAWALVTREWKYIVWPLKNYEQLFHRSLDLYDEYDILRNYHYNQKMVRRNEWIEPTYRIMMESFSPTNTTPYGDSIQSTTEIYKTLKARFLYLKLHILNGNKI